MSSTAGSSGGGIHASRESARRPRRRAEIARDPKSHYGLPESVFHLAGLPLSATAQDSSQALPPSSQSNTPWITLSDVQDRYDRKKRRRQYLKSRTAVKRGEAGQINPVAEAEGVRLDDQAALDRQAAHLISKHNLPSADLLQALHAHAAHLYASLGIIGTLRTPHQWELEQRHMREVAGAEKRAARRVAEPSGSASLSNNGHGSGSRSASDNNDSSSSDNETVVPTSSALDGKNGRKRRRHTPSPHRAARLEHGRQWREKRTRDMLEAFDGSALMALGVLVQQKALALLMDAGYRDPHPPDPATDGLLALQRPQLQSASQPVPDSAAPAPQLDTVADIARPTAGPPANGIHRPHANDD